MNEKYRLLIDTESRARAGGLGNKMVEDIPNPYNPPFTIE